MATYRVAINRKALNLTIDRVLGSSPYVKGVAYKMMAGIFRQSKRAMLREFDRHPVTVELNMGAEGINISDTLGGYGNLFSFIGFDTEDKPTKDLRDLLDVGTTLTQTIYKDRKWFFRVETPTKKAISGVTRMPWEEGNSWAWGVEQGISGLSHYLFRRWGGGRSGWGMQLPYETLEASFQTQPYLTKILGNFRDRVNNIRP